MRDNRKLDMDDVMDKCVCARVKARAMFVRQRQCKCACLRGHVLVHECVRVSVFSNKDKSSLIIMPEP